MDGGAGVCIPGRLKVTGKESLFCWRTGRLFLGRRVRTTFLHNHRHGGEGEHSIRDWRGSAKYLDTTLPLREFVKTNTFLKNDHDHQTIYELFCMFLQSGLVNNEV